MCHHHLGQHLNVQIVITWFIIIRISVNTVVSSYDNFQFFNFQITSLISNLEQQFTDWEDFELEKIGNVQKYSEWA